MQTQTLRVLGLGLGAALLAAAIALAVIAGAPEAAPPSQKVTAGPLPPSANAGAQPAPESEIGNGAETGQEGESMKALNLAFEPAAADTPDDGLRMAFIVRFEGGHAMVRAQDLAAAGRIPEARAAAIRALRGALELDGLCFDRFTAGGAEIVLAPCAPVPPGARAQFNAQWRARFADMRGVAYADVNMVANQNFE